MTSGLLSSLPATETVFVAKKGIALLVRFIGLGMPLRLLAIALVALVAARFINWAIVNWAYFRKSQGPWAKPPQGELPHCWRDHLPVVGWFALRRESKSHGKLFWLRPLLIELLFPLAVAWYYHFYVSGGSLGAGQAARLLAPELHWQFLAHFFLFVLMMIATFIDFDEQSIPDYVTIPGTIIGLVGSAFAAAWLPFHQAPLAWEELHAGMPEGWPLILNGSRGLFIAFAIIIVWGFALLDRRWIGRRGLGKGVQYFMARMFRNTWLWKSVCVVTAAMLVGVYLAWASPAMNPGRWTYLLSSLLGLAFAGGVTWAARLAASWALQVEALGFGDVTLMAMIGTYIGWQPSLLVFFIAPIVALLFVFVRWIVTGSNATPYGPYLCAATVIMLVYWDAIWTRWAVARFALFGNAFIVGTIVTCVVLMGAMLWIWRLIKEARGIAGH